MFQALFLSNPLGSPKYIPPVNSRTIIISVFSIISDFKLDESINGLNIVAGLKLENRFRLFLSLRSACSGFLLCSTLSHLGPPTAPRKTESASKHSDKVSSVNGIPYLSIDIPPTYFSIISNSKSFNSEMAFNILTAEDVISGPIPSPGNVIILNFFISVLNI